jgi:AcrR family transcriptional regulator
LRNKNLGLEKFDGFTEKGKLRIDEICHEAAKVFSEKGYQAATLEDVAQEAGSSKGGIYHYFSSKEELFFLILNRYMDQTICRLENILNSTSSPQEKLRLFIRNHVDHFSNTPHESSLIVHDARSLPGNHWEIIRGKEIRYLNILRSIIKNLMSKSEMSEEEIIIITHSLMGMCNSIYSWYDPNGKIRPHEVADEIYRILMGRLLTN